MAGILVVSPHPDDESLGCGGAIRRHVEHGDRVSVVFLTSGERGWRGHSAEETARVREGEAETAAQILGVAAVEFWREADGDLRATAALAHRIRERVERDRPDRMYVTHDAEMHPDHRAAAEIAQSALASFREAPLPALLGFEVWTPLQAIDEILDITDQLPAKLAAIRAHHSQCEVLAFDAAFEGLARYRGEMHSWPGGPYAEVFRRLDTVP